MFLASTIIYDYKFKTFSKSKTHQAFGVVVEDHLILEEISCYLLIDPFCGLKFAKSYF